MARVDFSDRAINVDVLRERAYNYRWATVPRHIIPLTAADPDFPIAPEIREAMISYIKKGVMSYGPAEGLPEFRQQISHTLRTRRGLDISPDLILPIDSAASAMYTVARLALGPGDEAIIFDPVDFLFKKSVEAAGAKAVPCPFDWERNTFRLDLLENLINNRTKLIGVCNPHNPLGRLMTRDELTYVAEAAKAHGLYILNDEIWSDIVYPPAEFFSMQSLPDGLREKLVSVYGFSKTFGLAGLRVGYLVASNPEVCEQAIVSAHVRTTAGGVATLSQISAMTAYDTCWYWVDEFVQHLEKARNYTVSRLRSMPGIRCELPAATYVAFPDISALGMTATEIAHYLLTEAGVAVVPGEESFFGAGAAGHIRLCFATSLGLLEQAMDRIEAALVTLS
jgi:aspartate/methionine/tyrosine aminotransferase